ncbi:MAG: MBL fold metallo-hydrolase [Desulfurococcales archaeon]|nr:MBL fold metallo-hydrolase [Desulfurococcales archaeon]
MVTRVVAGPLEANSYILRGDGGCVVVDPGGCDVARVLEACDRASILITHGHFDHVAGLKCVLESINVEEVVAHRLVAEVYRESLRLASMWGLDVEEASLSVTRALEGDEDLSLYGFKVKALYTPGHSPDHTVYYIPSLSILFSGDLLFKGSIGRWDLPGGDASLLEESLKRVSRLPGDTRVLPGHGDDTVLGVEMRVNPLLQLALKGMLEHYSTF